MQPLRHRINPKTFLNTLNALWQSIVREAQRYTKEALSRLEAIWQQRYTDLSSRQQS